MQLWAEPFVPLRLPKLFNLRADPFERADITSNTYWDWLAENGILVIAASGLVGQFLQTFKEFPPRQKAASFTIEGGGQARGLPHRRPVGAALWPTFRYPGRLAGRGRTTDRWP
jgi:hypothetical protein